MHEEHLFEWNVSAFTYANLLWCSIKSYLEAFLLLSPKLVYVIHCWIAAYRDIFQNFFVACHVPPFWLWFLFINFFFLLRFLPHEFIIFICSQSYRGLHYYFIESSCLILCLLLQITSQQLLDLKHYGHLIESLCFKFLLMHIILLLSHFSCFHHELFTVLLWFLCWWFSNSIISYNSLPGEPFMGLMLLIFKCSTWVGSIKWIFWVSNVHFIL